MLTAGSGGGSGGNGGGGGEGGTGGKSGMDAAMPPLTECRPNPNTLDEVCTEMCPEKCNGEDDDCDRMIDEGEAHDDCATAHTEALCQLGGKCLIARCLDGYRDCNSLAADGCEIEPDDIDNCGRCGKTCSVDNGTPVCKSGVCGRKKCNKGWDDCDEDPMTCETLTNTLADCGGCGVECDDLEHASPTCDTGACAVEQCNAGFDDCDKEQDNGCEQKLNTVLHCGDCDTTCSFPGSEVTCDETTQLCIATMCKEGMGYFDCDDDPLDGCESIKTAENCGECGKVCSAEALADVATASCSTGECQVTCEDGFGDCDEDAFNGCETEVDTVLHCGDCDACPSQNMVAACTDGVCTKVDCVGNYGDCDDDLENGCETPLDTLTNCGACKVPCNLVSCNGGTCTSVDCSLTPGYGDCDDDGLTCETNLATDLDNCGGCDVKCEWNMGITPNATLACTAQGCKANCDDGYGDCDGNYKNGCEASLESTTHCGMCGQGCAIANATATCATGTCQVASCASDYDDCNNDDLTCETPLNTPSNCGACGTGCNLPNAVEGCGGTAGARSCTVVGCEQSYYRNCDTLVGNGCEVDTRSDGLNCGACNTNCGALPNVATTSCVDSACVVGTCDPGYGNCTTAAGCETALNTVQTCGACNVNCNNTLANTATTTCDAMTLTCKVGTCDPGFSDCDGIASNGCETNIYSVQNCGGCANLGQNTPCQNLANATSACATGTCTISACNTNYTNCDATVSNGCERDTRAVSSGGQGPCLPDASCTKRVSGTHEYYTCTAAKTWTVARDLCRAQKNGDLAQINDATEKTFVTAGITVSSWIGGNDVDVEALWVWSQNEMPFWQGTSTGSAQLGQYANWASGEPNNTGDCMQLYTSGLFDDTNCASSLQWVCEVNPDDCASDPNKIQPGQCGCGNPDTDADNDGFAVCNDACDNDVNKRAAGACGCGVADTNTDGDAQPDCIDLCDNDPNKTVLGVCGCGIADTDSDNDMFANCIENCDNDPNKQDLGACGCGVADTNMDGDAQADCNETCDSDPNKLAPGQCGCSVADTDSDGDGTANCNDMCPNNGPKTAPGVCGCATADTDSDSDGTPNCNDGCISDPNKTAPGACGCGTVDTDTDSDSVPDCSEMCDTDPSKTLPGQCGCGIPDNDTDADGTANCSDTCPFDSSNAAGCFKKTSSNVDPLAWSFATAPTWNCNAAGTTTVDSTAGTVTSTSCALGTLAITNNVAQTKPGLHYGKITGGWNTTTANPANLTFDPLGPSITEQSTEVASGGGERWLDGTTYVYTGEIYVTSSGVVSFMEHIDDNVYLKIDSTVVLNDTAWTNATAGKFTGTQGWHTFELRVYDGSGGQGPSLQAPTGRPALGYSPTDTAGSTNFTSYTWPRNMDSSTASLFRASAGGSNVMVVRLNGMTVSTGHIVKVQGNKPVVFLVAGNVSITSSAVIDANATTTTAGAGGNLSCGSSTGGNGSGNADDNGTGGGGGGFATTGGVGGPYPGNSNGGVAGATRGSTTLAPLMGGCSGGNGGGCTGSAGGGAGAVQISAGGSMTISAIVRANGGVGTTGCGDEGGGGGGGSGGGILLEANAINATGGTIEAKGGAGGRGAASGANGGAGAATSAANGSNGTSDNDGAGGGGGGYGRRKATAATTCTACP